MNSTLKKILDGDGPSSPYERKLSSLCQKVSNEFEEVGVEEFKDYCRTLPQLCGLKEIQHFMNDREGPIG